MRNREIIVFLSVTVLVVLSSGSGKLDTPPGGAFSMNGLALMAPAEGRPGPNSITYDYRGVQVGLDEQGRMKMLYGGAIAVEGKVILGHNATKEMCIDVLGPPDVVYDDFCSWRVRPEVQLAMRGGKNQPNRLSLVQVTP